MDCEGKRKKDVTWSKVADSEPQNLDSLNLVLTGDSAS